MSFQSLCTAVTAVGRAVAGCGLFSPVDLVLASCFAVNFLLASELLRIGRSFAGFWNYLHGSSWSWPGYHCLLCCCLQQMNFRWLSNQLRRDFCIGMGMAGLRCSFHCSCGQRMWQASESSFERWTAMFSHLIYTITFCSMTLADSPSSGSFIRIIAFYNLIIESIPQWWAWTPLYIRPLSENVPDFPYSSSLSSSSMMHST